MKRLNSWLLASALGLASVGAASAAEILISEDIRTSTTWTADNVYNLQKQVYVLPGASLTIEAGTLVRSTADLGGSLAVTPGAKIYVNGTRNNPVVMTSTNDDMVTWREATNEWGNLTILGRGIISGSHFSGQPVEIAEVESGIPGGPITTRVNTKVPDGLNRRQMEGLVAEFPGDPRVLYGGNDDDDDSGSISYLSLRYTGKVIGLGNELNGISLGGIGRETDIQYLEVMNNVDDGIEIWGGTVNMKYVVVWNIGDDSVDVDQGWRGKMQFGLIVQGHSDDAPQGSGVGDNVFELDGAEDSDAQPVTTSTFYNFTVVGQPLDGDHGTAWRDNARAQFRNCIFMDLGEELIRLDNSDGDGGSGYGFNGTLTWEETWNTPYTYTSPVNIGTANPAELYTVQTSGNLSEITDSVFYNNLHEKAYTQAEALGVLAPENNNVIATSSPIQELQRGPLVVRGGKNMLPVTFINPLPANDALTSVSAAPDDGFFTPAYYRGAFAPNDNWLIGWTAMSAYGITTGSSSVSGWTDMK